MLNLHHHEVQQLAREAAQKFGEAVSGDHPWFQVATNILREALVKNERFDEAETFLVGSLESLRSTYGDSHYTTQGALERVVKLFELTGDAERAAEYRTLLTK